MNNQDILTYVNKTGLKSNVQINVRIVFDAFAWQKYKQDYKKFKLTSGKLICVIKNMD